MQLTKQSANTSMAFECYVDSALYKLKKFSAKHSRSVLS